MADVLSQINTHLGQEAVQSILVGVTLGTAQRAEGDDPAVVEGDHEIEKEVCVTAGQVLVEMHVMDWAAAQREDPKLNAVLCWLEAKKKTDLRPSSKEELPKFHSPPRHPLSVLHAQRGEWGAISLHSANGALDCYLKWVSLRCRTSRL